MAGRHVLQTHPLDSSGLTWLVFRRARFGLVLTDVLSAVSEYFVFEDPSDCRLGLTALRP